MTALTLATALFMWSFATPAFANYSECMKFCKEDHDFAYCHKICSGHSDKAPAARTGGGDCSTKDKKMYRFRNYIDDHYGPAFSMIAPSREDRNLLEVIFYPYNRKNPKEERKCKGTVIVTDDCRVTDLKGNVLANERLRRQTITCRSL